MKNIFVFLTLSFISLQTVDAQKQERFHSDVKLKEVSEVEYKLLDEFANNLKAINSKGTSSLWFNTREGYNTLGISGDYKSYAFPVFPDTTMLVYYTSKYYKVWLHSLAVTTHPSASIYASNGWNEYTKFTIDSVKLPIKYKRKTTDNIVDTLVFQFTRFRKIDTLKASWVKNDYGVDELVTPVVYHDAGTWKNTNSSDLIGNGSHGEKGTYKIPLTKATADAANSSGYIDLSYGLSPPITPDLTYGEAFHMSMSFVPGYNYTPNKDTLDNYNRLDLFTVEQNTNDFQTYLHGDYNTSHEMNDNHLKNNRTFYYPSYLFDNKTYQKEFHWVSFKLTALNVGVDDKNEVLNVEQNRPNPFSDFTTIDYSLNKNSNVNLEVYNIAGSKVLSINEGNKSAGSHQIIIDGTNLESGIYFYTLTAGDYKVTKKMIVY